MSKDLLLQDYQYRAEALWKSEQSGETRVQLFIAFVTAVGAALGFFVKEKLATGEQLRFVLLGWLLALLIVGLITLARMIIRNEHTDKCKKGLDAIRQVFRDIDPGGALLHYYPVEPPRIPKPGESRGGWWGQYKKTVQPRKFGGLAHTVAAINALIIGAGITVAITPTTGLGPPPGWEAESLWVAGIYGLIGAAIVFLAQLAYVAQREADSKARLRLGYATHAGGVVFRNRGDGVEYLLVSAKDEPEKQVLPKGHIEDGEGHAEAALREVCEEAGVVARPLELVASNLAFEARGELVNAKFYLMKWLYDAPRKERRETEWLHYDEALAKLKFPESQYALKQAEARRVAAAREASSRVLQANGLSAARVERAPDGSEVRPLSELEGGSVTHCTLPPGQVSRPVRHQTVEEIWYCLGGQGQVWRRLGDEEKLLHVSPGTSLTIPRGASFQFRNTGSEPLAFIIATMPPWPGQDEAVPAAGRW